MSTVLETNATANDYTAANTREQGGTVRLTLEVFNASIYYQLKRVHGDWGPDVPKAPGRFALDRRCDGLRVRSKIAATPAVVHAELLEAADLPGARA